MSWHLALPVSIGGEATEDHELTDGELELVADIAAMAASTPELLATVAVHVLDDTLVDVLGGAAVGLYRLCIGTMTPEEVRSHWRGNVNEPMDEWHAYSWAATEQMIRLMLRDRDPAICWDDDTEEP